MFIETQPDSGGGSRAGRNFAIDRTVWIAACEIGLNEAIALMVMARGTGGCNRTTSWSVNVIEKRTGMSRDKARAAIARLEAASLLVRLKTGKRPQYSLHHSDDPRLIWFPNTLVDGLTEEVAPVELLRQSQNVFAVRLFGELYFHQRMDLNGGIEWHLGAGIRETYTRSLVHQLRDYSVFSFTPNGQSEWHPDADIFHVGIPRAARIKEFWTAFRLLETLGLLYAVEHVVDADSASGEIVHPLPQHGNGEVAEDYLSAAVQDFVDAWRLGHPGILVPVRRHMEHAQLIGIYRMRYLPNTAATQAWLARSSEWISLAERFRNAVAK